MPSGIVSQLATFAAICYMDAMHTYTSTEAAWNSHAGGAHMLTRQPASVSAAGWATTARHFAYSGTMGACRRGWGMLMLEN